MSEEAVGSGSGEGRTDLARDLSLFDITMIGVGAMIGIGWRGRRKRRFANLVLGSVIDRVVLDAPTDVCVAKLGGTGEPRRVVVPTAGGPHADAAADLAAGFLSDPESEITLLTVVDGERGEPETTRCRLAEEVVPGEAARRLRTATIEDGEVADRILEWTREHRADMIVMGSTEQGLLRQALFGAIPEQIGERFEGTALMVRRHLPVRSTLRGWVRRWLGRRRSGGGGEARR